MRNDKNKQIAIDKIFKARESKSLFLDLSGLNLYELPDDISDLDNIIELDLSYNFLYELPQSVARMKDLKKLNISHNYISNIDFIEGTYYSLEVLDISNNSIYNIPDSLNYLINCESILFENNPFIDDLPLTIANYDIRYIQEYLKLNTYTEKQRFYEMKLIFVGKGEVGKTTLIKILKDKSISIDGGSESATHGISIDTMELEVFFPAKPPHYMHYNQIEDVYEVLTKDEINYYQITDFEKSDEKYYVSFADQFSNMDEDNKIEIMMLDNLSSRYEIKKSIKTNLWDFGGQEIYHSTHQFFLTKRSIYIFVWEPRKDGIEEEFEYWLNIINLLGQECPILIVMNKADIRYVSIDEKRYKEMFPKILSFFQVSCLNKTGIEELKAGINDCIRTLQHLGEEIPKSWIEIRNKLTADTRDYIFITDFKKICSESIRNISSRHLEHISDYLHDIGEIIHFKNSHILRSIIIINPQWATKAVYSLIDNIPIQKKHGIFDFYDMENYLDTDQYPAETHIQLLELMERFEICFRTVGDANKFILPELLKNEIPNEKIVQTLLQEKQAFKFKYSFNFLPGGILSRLLCKLFYLLNSENYWKNGAIFNYESTSALVLFNRISKTMNLSISGENKRDLFGLIKNELNQIFKILNMQENIDYFEEIPCNCSMCIADQNPFYFRNNTLKTFLKNDKKTIDCYKSSLSVSIDDLLFLYRNTNASKSIIYDILFAVSRLQGLSKIIDKSEDSRNTLISDYLSHLGVIAKDQSKWGASSSGLKMGEIDIRIDSTEGHFLTFYEGMNLDYLNKTTITKHIEKVIKKYDPLGVPEKFIGCYCGAKDFDDLAKNYFAFLQDLSGDIVTFTEIFDVTTDFTPYTEIRIFKTYYYRSKVKTTLTHLLINMT